MWLNGVGHDDSGFGSGWFLDRVSVRNELSGDEYHFKAARWYRIYYISVFVCVCLIDVLFSLCKVG